MEVMGLFLGVIGATDGGVSLTVIAVGAITALVTALAALAGVLITSRDNKRKADLAEEVATEEHNSIGFNELERLVPGLGALVDRYEQAASHEYDLKMAAQEKTVADHMMILELRSELQQLRVELRVSEAKNVQLERRVAQLESERDAR